jgi:hypothetical protein
MSVIIAKTVPNSNPVNPIGDIPETPIISPTPRSDRLTVCIPFSKLKEMVTKIVPLTRPQRVAMLRNELEAWDRLSDEAWKQIDELEK